MSSNRRYAKSVVLDPRTCLPAVRGTTRQKGGQLEYLSPLNDDWIPAVHLQEIRQRLLTQSFQQNNGQGYKFPKSHGNWRDRNPLDHTSFLLQDEMYGGDRTNRHPILFQLKPTKQAQSWQTPSGYVMDAGRVVLDPYDHAIRDFGNDLPLCLSSQIEGHDIETYMRRNKEITFYDLIGESTEC